MVVETTTVIMTDGEGSTTNIDLTGEDAKKVAVYAAGLKFAAEIEKHTCTYGVYDLKNAPKWPHMRPCGEVAVGTVTEQSKQPAEISPRCMTHLSE